MPISLATLFRGLWCSSAFALVGCFGSEPDDSPYTLPRGEAFHSLQLEIEPDGTPLIIAQVAMQMAHNDPDSSLPEENRVAIQNYRSILLRRSTGVWSATAFKNIQPYPSDFPSLIPDSEGRFQAFLTDGGEIKRYAFGNGKWNRVPGTQGLQEIGQGGFSFGKMNWNRHPSIAVAGTNLLLTLHNDWNRNHWVMEGNDRRVMVDSSDLYPVAFHSGKGYRSLAAMGYISYIGPNNEIHSTSQLHYYRWAEGANRAEKQVLGGVQSQEAYFARYRGRTALFASTREAVLIYSLDDSGRVAGRDSLPLPDLTKMFYPVVAVDTAGCLHGLSAPSDSGDGAIRYLHWNGCGPGSVDTLSVPKPNPAKSYWGYQANLRVAPDGTPVVALVMREIRDTGSSFIIESWSDPTFLYLAELREGGWRLEKVDERRPSISAR